LNRGGIESMYGVIVLILLALGLGGLMRKVGILQVLCDELLKWADTVGKLTTSTIYVLAGVWVIFCFSI